MFVIGIDPHKGSHTAAVLDRDEQLCAELRVRADRHQRDRLLRWAESFEPRTWAIEAASGLGSLLAQQLLAAGEVVVDVPPTLSARARLLDSGNTDKTDPHDARSAAVVALRHPGLRVVAREDYSAVLRLQAKRHHDLIALRPSGLSAARAVVPAGSRWPSSSSLGHPRRRGVRSHSAHRHDQRRTQAHGGRAVGRGPPA